MYRYGTLTSAVAGSERSTSRHCHFPPGERATGTHCIGGLANPRAGLGDPTVTRTLTLSRPASSQ
jgi:hypothetical protein